MAKTATGGNSHARDVKQRVCARLYCVDQCLRFPPFDYGWIARGDPTKRQWWEDSPESGLTRQLHPQDDRPLIVAPKDHILEKPNDPDIIAGFCDKLAFWLSELLLDLENSDTSRCIGHTFAKSLRTTIVALSPALDGETINVAKEFLRSDALKPGRSVSQDLAARRDLAVQVIRESIRQANQIAGARFAEALAVLALISNEKAEKPRDDKPTPTDIENVRKVMKDMARNPSVERIREAVRKAGYRMSATKIGKAVKIVSGK